jgi:hypothetical protein
MDLQLEWEVEVFGDLALEAMSLNPNKIIGLDIAEQMLVVGREKIAHGGEQSPHFTRFLVAALARIHAESRHRGIEPRGRMPGRSHGNVNGAFGGAGRGEIGECSVRIAHAVQNIVGQHRVEISADQFAERGLIEPALIAAARSRYATNSVAMSCVPMSDAATPTSRPDGRRLRWLASRRTHREPRPDGATDAATDSWLSLVDEAGGPAAVSDLMVHTRAVCTNRNRPARLPFAVGRPRLTLPEGQGPIGTIRCLTRPTRPLRVVPGRGSAWRIISHLSLNHLSLADAGDGRAPRALREMLRLYLLEDLDDYDQKQRWIQGIVGVTSRRVAARIEDQGAVCQGLEIRLDLDEEQFSDRASDLFCSVLDRFLGAWVTINSFTRLVATSRQRESRQEQWRWPPRAGGKVLA